MKDRVDQRSAWRDCHVRHSSSELVIDDPGLLEIELSPGGVRYLGQLSEGSASLEGIAHTPTVFSTETLIQPA